MVSSGLFSFNFLIKACALINLSSQPPAELRRESVLRLLIQFSSSQFGFGLAFSKGEKVMITEKSKIFSSLLTLVHTDFYQTDKAGKIMQNLKLEMKAGSGTM